MPSYRAHDSTSCHVTTRDISRFLSVIFCTGHRYNVKRKLSNLETKNTSFVNISASLHLMLLLMATTCSLTLIVFWSRALKIQQRFRVLFVHRIVAGKRPVSWLISLTETSFSSAKNKMYACSAALKAHIKTLHRK